MDLKSNKRNFYIVAGISALIMYVLLKKDFSGVVSGLRSANLYFLALATVMMAIYILLEAVPFYLIFRSRVQKISFSLIAKITFATQFFNAITPFSTGGQPFQIYIINKKNGISYGRITSISLQNFIVYQTALVIQGFFALFAHYVWESSFISFDRKTSILIILGLGINFLIIAGLTVIANSKRLSHFISITLINFLAKLRIVKNPEGAREATNKFLCDFHRDIEVLSQDKKLFCFTVFINLIKLTLFYTLAYVLCMAIGIHDVSLLSVIIASSFTMLISSVFPVPGASGGAELGFLIFFAPIISGSSATIIMLMWRFFTYYMGLILGFLIFLFVFHGKDSPQEA